MKHWKGRYQRMIGLAAAVMMLFGLTWFPVKAYGSMQAVRIVRIPYGINDQLYKDQNGNVTGYSKDYLDKLAKINNWEYEYVEASWSEAVEMLEDGGIDILFPTSKTEDREKTMDFPSMIGGYMASGLFALDNSGYDYEDYESFDGARIGVTENSSNKEELAEFAREHGFTYEPVYIDSVREKIEALENGTVDMIMFSAANNVEDGKLVSVFDAHPFYYSVKKGNEELLEELENGMKRLLMEEPDLMSQMLQGCLIGENGSKVAFTTEEHQFISEGTPIRVGFYLDTEPLAYADKEGQYNGIYIELLEMVQRSSGVNLELYPIDRDEYWQDLLLDGTIDFCIGSSRKVSASDKRFVSTDSFMDYDSVLITRNDYELQGNGHYKMALTKARAYWVEDLSDGSGDMEVIYYKTAKDCLIAVKNGEADMTLLNTIEYNYQSKNTRFSDLVQWESYRYNSEVCMTAAKDIDDVKFSSMEKALGTLSEDEVNTVINTHLNMPYETGDFSDYLYGIRYFLAVLGLILVMAAVVFIVVWRIRRKQKLLLEENREREKRQLNILAAMSMDYASIYYVNLDTDLFTAEKMSNQLRKDVEDVVRESQVYSETMERYIADFVQPEHQEKLRQLCDREYLLKRFQTESDITVRYQVNPNKEQQEYFEIHFVNISENEEEHTAVLGFRCVDDIAKEDIAQKRALKEAFDAANQANQAKSEFLSKMSHDIRTPINAIVGMTALAGVHIDNKERVQDALSKIASSSRYLLGLINEVLDMSKIESGKVHLSEEEFNLPELINGLITMMQPQVQKHGHDLQVYIQDFEHEDVVGDSLRIQQVFTNIMNNAIKYTPNHGKITVTIREKPYNKHRIGCYELIFEDNGIGMTKEYIKHLFEPFSRAEDVRISKIQGTGLGMPIAQNIVHMMNGTIEVESEVGRGSVFTVTIFLKLQDQQDIQIEELEGLPVLVADDDQISCEFTGQMLADIGMDPEWVLSGAEAVERVKLRRREEQDYYAVILDWKMPEMDGVETARAIRRIVGPEVSIIILTAYDWTDVEEEARNAGVDAFLNKPVYKSELARMFKNLKSENREWDQEPKAAQQALDEMIESDYSGKKALLVEDNELNREIASEILKMAGLEVEEAEDGKIAVDMFSASEPGYYDIIFMDVQMPVMNGYEATLAIRSLDRPDAAKIPIAAMTANAFVEDMQAAKNAGMDEYLTKPLEFNKLKSVLDKHLR